MVHGSCTKQLWEVAFMVRTSCRNCFPEWLHASIQVEEGAVGGMASITGTPSPMPGAFAPFVPPPSLPLD